jgi:muramoyltetrapeptide carboxypeptidase
VPQPTPRTLGLIAPSGAIADPALLEMAAQQLAARGWRLVPGDGALRRHQRFAGTDAERLLELQSRCCDPSLDVVMAARGGYGISRLLASIDFAAIRRAERIIVGFSDFTAFNLAYLARAGGISFQGPALADLVAAAGDRFTAEQFFATIASPSCDLAFDARRVNGGPRRGAGARLAVAGQLWGGNLSLLCALLATPFFPDVRGGILVLEDVNEAPYRIERMLYQLLHAGVLARQQAIVLGDFDRAAPIAAAASAATDHGYDLDAALRQIGSQVAVPIFCGLPFGHRAHRVSLPIGAHAALQVDGDSASLRLSGYPHLRHGAGRTDG